MRRLLSRIVPDDPPIDLDREIAASNPDRSRTLLLEVLDSVGLIGSTSVHEAVFRVEFDSAHAEIANTVDVYVPVARTPKRGDVWRYRLGEHWRAPITDGATADAQVGHHIIFPAGNLRVRVSETNGKHE